MRQGFSRQLQLDCIAISEIQMNLNCRDEMIPILRGDDQKMNPLCWHYHLMDRDDQDRDVAVEQSSLLQKRMEGNIEFLSFDRGFHSPKNQIDKKTPRRRVLPPAILTAANRKTKIAKNKSFAPIEGNKTTTLLKTKIFPPPPPPKYHPEIPQT